MSALGNKGEKNQSKYKAIDINNLFKGSSVTPQKAAPASRQHGLQSLGKVSSVRRMPPPANLPSLKSEGSGSDINLIANSSGWTKEDASSADSPVSPPIAVSLQQQPSCSSQPVSRASDQRQPADVNFPHPATAPTNVLWSSVTSNTRRPGNVFDQQSSLFQEEFPQLTSSAEDKMTTSKRADEIKDAQRGPVLDPKHQGAAAAEPGAVAEAEKDLMAGEAVMRMPLGAQPQMPFPGMPLMHLRPGMPGMPPNFRGMMMPFGFRPGFPPNCPPNFPRGLSRPPYVNPADFRFPAGMYPMQPWNYGPGQSSEEPSDRPSIIKEKDLEQFDKLSISDGGWAAPAEDVDYSERLVFSDEEDASAPPEKSVSEAGDRAKRGGDEPQSKRHVDHERDHSDHSSRDSDHDRLSAYDRQMSSESAGSPVTPREAWMSMSGPFARLPAPPHVTGDRKHWRMDAPHDNRASSLSFQQPPFFQRPAAYAMRMDAGSGLERDDDAELQQRRKQQSESMMAAIERARQRREDDERRIKDEQSIGRVKHQLTDDREENGGSVKEADTVDYGSRQKTELEQSSDSSPRLAPSPSGSVSPRPPLTHYQPRMPGPRPTVGGYWPYDSRAASAWGPIVTAPMRYMMDPRSYMWHMSQGGSIRPVAARRPGTDTAADFQDQGVQYDQHVMNMQSYYGPVPSDHKNNTRQLSGSSEQPVEPTMSRHCSDGDGSRAASNNTNSSLDSARNDSNPADNELPGSTQSGSVDPVKISGRRFNSHRSDRNSGSYVGERSKNVRQDVEGRMPTGAQKQRTDHPHQPVTDVKPTETSSAPSQVSSTVVSGSPHTSLSNSLSSAVSSEEKAERKESVSKTGRRFNQGASGRQYQGSKQQRRHERARKPEGAVGARSEGQDRQAEDHDKKLDRDAGSSGKDERVQDNRTKANVHRPKDGSDRSPRDYRDDEKVQVNISSREFVRGGRGRLHGSARGRGRGGHQDVHGSASHREVESLSQRESLDDTSSSATARSNGIERKRAGDGRVNARQSKTEDGKSVESTKLSAADQRSDHGIVQSPSDGRRSKQSDGKNAPSKDSIRRSDHSAKNTRRGTEFYDSRNRGQRMRRSDVQASGAGKPDQQSKCSDAKAVSNNSPANDGTDVDKNTTASSQDVADTSGNKCSNEAASEQTSRRKSGSRKRRPAWHGSRTAAVASSSSTATLEGDSNQLPASETRPNDGRDSSKWTSSEYRRSKTSRPERHKRGPAGRYSADGGTTHEEWETASESSDVLKDNDVPKQSQSSVGSRHSSSRQDSKRGYSNQRHTQSRRGRYRDRPSADGGSTSAVGQHEASTDSSARVDTKMNQANSATVAVADSDRPTTAPPTGDTHPVYRLDHVVFDNPGAIRSAIADAFIRNRIVSCNHWPCADTSSVSGVWNCWD